MPPSFAPALPSLHDAIVPRRQPEALAKLEGTVREMQQKLEDMTSAAESAPLIDRIVQSSSPEGFEGMDAMDALREAQASGLSVHELLHIKAAKREKSEPRGRGKGKKRKEKNFGIHPGDQLSKKEARRIKRRAQKAKERREAAAAGRGDEL